MLSYDVINKIDNRLMICIQIIVVAYYLFISLPHCCTFALTQDLEQDEFDDYYPQSIKKFSVRKDIYSKEYRNYIVIIICLMHFEMNIFFEFYK